jgi:hypothetical protein
VFQSNQALPYFVCVSPQWDTKSSRQTKISQLEIAFPINQQVLWLQVAVKNPMTMAVFDSLNQLCHKLLNNLWSHSKRLQIWTSAFWKCFSTTTLADWQRFHVLFQIQVEELKDEVEFVSVGVYDVQEADDARVVHFLEERDFTNGGGWNAFIFSFKADLLESDDSLV